MAHKRPRSAFEADLQKQESPFVVYGTPLPPLDSETRDDGSYVPVWKQEVTDERGRKRLHGAFTGGYSAGYFNTVGSKEGWTPSTFVSSRSNRRKDEPKQLRPEDYMDEEDLAEQAEAQKLQPNEAFAGFGTTIEEAARRGKFMDLFRPQGETMGVKLLRKMGWRDGQGIGPKVKRKARFEEDGEPDGVELAFAPDDMPVIAAGKKDDRKGVGFAGEEGLNGASRPLGPKQGGDDNDGLSVDPQRQSANRKASGKPQKTGFGMGVLNDTGSDDEDPYEMGPRVSYNKVIGGDRRKAKAKAGLVKPSASSANPLVGSKPVFKPQKFSSNSSSSGFRKCHDGRLPLDGFLLSDPLQSLSISEDSEQYPVPTIPEGWTSSKPTAKPQSTSSFKSAAEAAKASTLDPKSRAALLGETPLPGKSIFDYLTPATRDRLAAASGRQDLPAGRGEAPPISSTTSTAPSVEAKQPLPTLDKDTPTAALSRGTAGWMPYTEDPPKRDRYRNFLEYSAGLRDTPPVRPPSLPEQLWHNELHEFAHAARVFKPVTGAMAARFQSSSSSTAPQSSSETRTEATKDGNGNSNTALSFPKSSKPKDPAEEAAALGLYGPLTRQVLTFYPSRLVCKRFGVKVPAHVTSGNEGRAAHAQGVEDVVEGKEMGVSVGSAMGRTDAAGTHQARGLVGFTRGPTEHVGVMEGGGTAAGGLRVAAKTENEPADTTGEPMDRKGELPSGKQAVGEQRLGEQGVDTEKNEALEAQRAGEELFRAVFGDDEDDE